MEDVFPFQTLMILLGVMKGCGALDAYPSSHNHGSVENYPKWKETTITGLKFQQLQVVFNLFWRLGFKKRPQASEEWNPVISPPETWW